MSNVARRYEQQGRLDSTAAAQAIDDLQSWPGERYGHRSLLARVWELRESVRGWDAIYVALAEVLEATLVTLDGRLAAAVGSACAIEVIATDR
jgi:predicted nucleic acid-binding protein